MSSFTVVPAQHQLAGGRSMTYARGTPLDAIFASLGGDADQLPDHLNFAIQSPIAVITSVVDALFANGTSAARSVATASIIRIATANNVNPESVRLIATSIFKHWKAGVISFIVYTSFYVPDASLPLTESSNSSNSVCVDYRRRERYNRIRHHDTLECNDEFVCADTTNYIYKPTVQTNASTSMRLVIVSYGSMYNSGQTKKLRECMTELRAMDADWVHSMTTAMDGCMAPLLVSTMCVYIGSHIDMLIKKDVELSFSMRREGSLIRFSLVSNGRFDFDSASLDRVYRACIDKRKSDAPCCKCELRTQIIRCPYCDDLRYCTRDCALADEDEHTKTCRVYVRRNAVEGPRAPGGAIVMKESK